MALQLMLNFFPSLASVLLSPTSANLAALDAIELKKSQKKIHHTNLAARQALLHESALSARSEDNKAKLPANDGDFLIRGHNELLIISRYMDFDGDNQSWSFIMTLLMSLSHPANEHTGNSLGRASSIAAAVPGSKLVVYIESSILYVIVHYLIGFVYLALLPFEIFAFTLFCCRLLKWTMWTARKNAQTFVKNPRHLLRRMMQKTNILQVKIHSLLKLSHYLTNWRFYYDPPEFQCVLVGDLAKGYHLGYFRDSPKEMPAFVGSNSESDGCVIVPVADNLFGAISHLVSEKLKKVDPFQKTQLANLKKKLEDWAAKNSITIDSSNPKLKQRKKKVVAKTFYQCGIVVPVDSKTDVGYRKIPETDSNIKKICQRILDSKTESEKDKNSDDLQELVTYVQYANDEMDYGMGLELGLDLLAFGGEVFHPTVLHLLSVAYELLERPEYVTILKAHLACRKKIFTKPE
uniref:EOG090X0BAY n=1 Tax=Alona affinis TaxID=381656 RepID=A0A9N6WP72_9CRUS|nr:EOG090X0BAY [Alona affinis]